LTNIYKRFAEFYFAVMKKSALAATLTVALTLISLPIITVHAADPMPVTTQLCAPGQVPTPTQPCLIQGVIPGGGPGMPPSPSPMPSTDENGIPTTLSLSQTFTSKYPADPTQTFFSASTPTPGQVGIFFASNIRGAVLPSVEVRKADGQTFQAHQCKSVDDPSCDPSKNWIGLKVVSGIGNCYNDPTAATSCVESFSIIGSDGKEYKAQPEVKFPANASEFPGSPGLYPAGSAPWLWTVPGDPSGTGTEYLLTGYINSGAENKSVPGTKKMPGRGGVVNGKWFPLVTTFNFEVVPVYKESAPGIKATLAQEAVDNNGLHRVVSVPVQGCYAADDGVCLNRRPFMDGEQIKLTMHLSRRVSGWLVGRLDRPDISTSHINDNMDKVNIVAGVSKDVFAGKVATNSVFTNSMLQPPAACPNKDKFGAVRSGLQSFMGMDPGELCAIDFYKQLAPALGDKAFAITPSWTLTTSEQTSDTSKCITDTDGLAGVGATNASAYDPGAPTYDAKAGTLTYRVAAPSHGPDGSLIAGRYALSVAVPVFQCLYNVKSIPSQAKIGITSSDGKTVTQTVVVNQRDGWVNFAADNFDFSDTSVLTITLPKSAAATTSAKLTTITCVKAKSTRKVSGANPTCPAGYKQQ
jgi:hypothetical protein